MRIGATCQPQILRLRLGRGAPNSAQDGSRINAGPSTRIGAKSAPKPAQDDRSFAQDDSAWEICVRLRRPYGAWVVVSFCSQDFALGLTSSFPPGAHPC